MIPRIPCYRLVDGKPERCSYLQWAEFFEDHAARIVEQTDMQRPRDVGEPDRLQVSTVFLGHDMNFGNGPPLLWETMVFGFDGGEFQRRYQSVGWAKIGHFDLVNNLRTQGWQVADKESGELINEPVTGHPHINPPDPPEHPDDASARMIDPDAGRDRRIDLDS